MTGWRPGEAESRRQVRVVRIDQRFVEKAAVLRVDQAVCVEVELFPLVVRFARRRGEVPTQTVVQGQLARDLPIVLRVGGVDILIAVVDGVGVLRVARWKAEQQVRDAAGVGAALAGEAAGETQAAESRAVVADAGGQILVFEAELQGMRAARPGDRFPEIVSLRRIPGRHGGAAADIASGAGRHRDDRQAAAHTRIGDRTLQPNELAGARRAGQRRQLVVGAVIVAEPRLRNNPRRDDPRYTRRQALAPVLRCAERVRSGALRISGARRRREDVRVTTATKRRSTITCRRSGSSPS